MARQSRPIPLNSRKKWSTCNLAQNTHIPYLRQLIPAYATMYKKHPGTVPVTDSLLILIMGHNNRSSVCRQHHTCIRGIILLLLLLPIFITCWRGGVPTCNTYSISKIATAYRHSAQEQASFYTCRHSTTTHKNSDFIGNFFLTWVILAVLASLASPFLAIMTGSPNIIATSGIYLITQPGISYLDVSQNAFCSHWVRAGRVKDPGALLNTIWV